MEGMSTGIAVSLASAASFAVNSLVGKTLLRYRICNAGLVTWGTALATGLVSLVALVVTRQPFPTAVWPMLILLSVVLLGAGWLITKAFQEGDASTVAPLMGVKVPITAILAFFVLGEVHAAPVYLAVFSAGAAIALFGLGKQEKAQGGHGLRPSIPIAFACLAATLYAAADQIAKLCMVHTSSWTLVLWSSLTIGLLALPLFMHTHYRQYRVRWPDALLFLLRGVLLILSVGLLYIAYELVDGVTIPNVILSVRGLFVLVVGFLLSRVQKRPMERQSNAVYVARVVGTAFLVVSVLIVSLG
jgi:drug/metabolite transporter (DMT)-like permease